MEGGSERGRKWIMKVGENEHCFDERHVISVYVFSRSNYCCFCYEESNHITGFNNNIEFSVTNFRVITYCPLHVMLYNYLRCLCRRNGSWRYFVDTFCGVFSGISKSREKIYSNHALSGRAEGRRPRHTS